VNADEGDSGTFADRMLMEGDPFCLLEGMTIAAHAVGADRGLVYLRSEYPDAIATLQSAIWIAREQGWLGDNILDSDLCFDVEIRVGAGSYVCGEETAMLESLEGRRGMVRAKPPLPAIKGLFGTPTVINNVLTIASVPSIWPVVLRPTQRWVRTALWVHRCFSWQAISPVAALWRRRLASAQKS
jgi:formate dehydrogenase iron-sulfur subunit